MKSPKLSAKKVRDLALVSGFVENSLGELVVPAPEYDARQGLQRFAQLVQAETTARAAREAQREMQRLADTVLVYLAQLDSLMDQPGSLARDEKVARLANALEMANDGLRYRALGVDFRKDDKEKALLGAKKRLAKG